MKVVQINAVYGEKSTGSIVRDLDLLIQEKNDSYVVYKEASISAKNGFQLGNIVDWKYHAFRTRIDGKQAYSSYFCTVELIKKLDRICPDIIHLHNIHSNFINLPVLIKYVKRRSITLVLTLHDCWFFTGKCYHFADIGCEKWKIQCEQCPKRKRDIPSLFIDSSSKVFRDRKKLFDYENIYVVGCSNWITYMAEQSPLLAKAEFRTIYNGVNTHIFSPRETEKEKDMFTIVTMANKWFENENEKARKNVLDFLGKNGQILIIGCTPEQQRVYANDRKIKAIGYIKERTDLAALYAQGDIFLNLTHIDTLPTVNMEALSCGTPVVTYDAGGSGELVKEGLTGYIVDIDDVSGLLKALQKIRNGKISRDNCRTYAVENFDKTENFYKYINLYNSIMNKRRDV